MNKNIKNYYKKYSAFSMAEAMIILLIISIMLALSAPLIAGRSNVDKRSLIKKADNLNIIQTAVGRFQQFIIGPDGGNRDKLAFNGNVTANNIIEIGDGLFIDTDANGRNGIRYKNGGQTILEINDDGSSNIKINPATRTSTKCNGVCSAPDNGYIYANILGSTMTINPALAGRAISVPEASEIEPDLSIRVETTKIDGKEVTKLKNYPMLIPISKGTNYECNNCYFVPLTDSPINTYNSVKISATFQNTEEPIANLQVSPNYEKEGIVTENENNNTDHNEETEETDTPKRYEQVNDFINGKYNQSCSSRQKKGCYEYSFLSTTYYDSNGNKIATYSILNDIFGNGYKIFISDDESKYISYDGTNCYKSGTTGGENTCRAYGFTNCKTTYCSK